MADTDVTMSDVSGVASGSSVTVGMDWEPIKVKLLDADVDLSLEAAQELRERMEIVHTTEFPRMLASMLPAFSTVLSHLVKPNPDTTSTEHKVRNSVLEVLSRLPNNEVLRPHAAQILTVAMDVLVKDYEDNALLASRIIFDLHKNYRQMPQGQVQPYLDFVLQAYRSLPNSIQHNFRFATEVSTTGGTSASEAVPDTPAGAGTAMDTDDKTSTDKKKKPSPVAQTPPATALSPSGGIPTTPRPRLSPRSGASFRVLTECPLTVMLLFQLHPKFLKTNIQPMITLMMEALGLRAPALPPNVNSTTKRLYHSRSRELVATQVKTLSFLTQFLKGFSELLQPYQDVIAQNVVALMTICPPECIGTRRELLHATRHVLATDFRKGFFRHVDALLDERVLMGTHPKSSDQAVLRPLGYSTLADLVHHARSMLSMKQLSRVVYMFSRVVHDSSLQLPLAIQTTAVRLLLNLVDTIFHNKEPNAQLGRDLLARILDSLVRKLGVLQTYIPKVEEAEKLQQEETSDLEIAVAWNKAMVNNSTSETSDLTEDSTVAKSITREEKITKKLWSQDDASDVTDTLQDVQIMVRSIVVGLKTVIWCINNYHRQREKEPGRDQLTIPLGSNDEVSSAMHKLTHWEYGLIEKYIQYAIQCFQVFKEVSTDGKSSRITRPENLFVANQYRDVLTYFAAAFTVLDSFNLRRTIGAKIHLLADAIDRDHHSMVIPRHLLASNQKASYVFATTLLAYLSQHIEDLSTDVTDEYVFVDRHIDADNTDDCVPKEVVMGAFERSKGPQEARNKRASTILELFERVLKSLATFPDNEAALRPYLRKIVSTCLRSMMERADGWPDNNCILLRYTFRAISAGKFEESYKELLPLLPTILNGLNRIFIATEDTNLRHVIIELCLTVPARLSSLLPHMSLLLRMIIHGLNSNTGDLVNLGLRTLEFWVDNLNPDFLYPIMSKQTDYLTELMTALSSHLRPAPYPYGLLTLRLLGKLGGKNRCFLREPLDLVPFKRETLALSLSGEWALGDESDGTARDTAMDDTNDDGVKIALPLERAVEVLQLIVLSSENEKPAEMKDEERSDDDEDGSPGIKLKWDDYQKLRTLNPDQVDIQEYCTDVVAETKRSQAEAAFCVVRSTLATILDLEENSTNPVSKAYDDSSGTADTVATSKGTNDDSVNVVSQRKAWQAQTLRTATLKTVCEGLMYACAIDPIQEEAKALFQGFFSHIFLLVVSLSEHIKKIDSYGSQVSVDEGDAAEAKEVQDSDSSGGGSYPLGCFLLTGPFVGKANPLVLNEAIAEILVGASKSTQRVALDAIDSLIQMSRGSSRKPQKAAATDSLDECDVFFESLISVLFQASLSTPWNSRSGIHDGIFLVMDGLGREWSDRFEVEAMHVAILGLKEAPKDIPVAAVEAFQFFSRVCDRLYSSPTLSSATVDGYIQDPLTGVSSDDHDSDKSNATASYASPSEGVVKMLISELPSVKQIVRFSVRYAMKLYMVDSLSTPDLEEVLSSHMPTIKRLLFARSLRLLPLSEQVGVFDALAFLTQEIPSSIPLSDQHLLAFLSEFLKMASIGDGEMKDPNLSERVVDKNGFVISPQDGESPQAISQLSAAHTSSIFLRRECAAKSPVEGSYIVIPEELPYGVQLRVSGLRLFRAVIRQHVDEFFDADSATPIGNIRPHVISLLFRSLISHPPTAVIAAHLTLRDVLALSSAGDDKDKDSKPQSRLPKELLQTCIRPVLLNLREYTRLTVPLLQGLARLLSLLSSWFNTTLGEKLLEHLSKWADPDRSIISRQIWVEGEEPLVAAAILDLFSLLPQASQFVERLVKTTIKLELTLPAYKPREVASPYRRPLARYLNKHPQNAVGFFFQRLKTPVYSELFQAIVAMDESMPLREYISGPQCSASFLNICFERPLGIIRADQASSAKSSATPTSEKATNSPNLPEILALHGVSTGPASAKRDAEEFLRQDVEVKEKRVQAAQNDVACSKEQLKARLATKVVSDESHKALEEARVQQKIAQAALDRAQKDLKESKQRYASETAQSTPGDAESSSDGTDAVKTARPMNTEALELQLQGFRLVATLVANDDKYIEEHNDVVKAFRWLWRSKGRFVRLQHEEFIPPRYHDESTMLASFLVNTATAFPKDVDILYELLRIFLQPSTVDFSFVHRFLADTAANKLSMEQKRNLMKRLVSLIAGEGKEETKALGIQHIGIPILLSSLAESRNDATGSNDAQNEGRGESKAEGGDESAAPLLSQDIVNTFATDVLFKDGSPRVFGDQLRTELLRLSTLLLERADDMLAPHRKDVIKFSWSLLKSDDSSSKNWASLNLCRFISVFVTPPKNVLQVYVALLRSYQQEGKELVRLALGILVPVLPERLPSEEFQKMIDSTIKTMYEEGNSALQLAHVLHTVVANVNVFYDHRHRFVRHMINSLHRLALPPNCPIENRFLAIAIIELVLSWGGQSLSGVAEETPTVGTKRKEASNDYRNAPTDKSKKKMKTEGGESETVSDESTTAPLLDRDMVETIANFLVRLRILLADSKIEGRSRHLESETTRLFKAFISLWPDIAIRPLYFEKVVSMCLKETAANKVLPGGARDRSKVRGSGRSAGNGGGKGVSPRPDTSGPTPSTNLADDARISSALLSACLDIFVTLAKSAPESTFLKENSDKVTAILAPCFVRLGRHDGEKGIRQQLKDFLLLVLADDKQEMLDDAAVVRVKVLLESVILEAAGSDPAAPASGHKGSRDRSSRVEKGPGASSLAFFSVDLIEKVSVSSPDVVEYFTGSLLSLVETLFSKHIQDSVSNQRQGGLYPKQGVQKTARQKYPTPVSGILEMACSTTFIPDITGNNTKSSSGTSETGWPRQVPPIGSGLRSLTTSLRLLASSNILYTFNENRATLLRIISSILDSSDNVQLVMTAYSIVGDWLLEGIRTGPLTAPERITFLEKIALFDLNALSDVALQPVADLVADLVVELYEARKGGNDGKPTVECGKDEDIPLARALVACSINANPQIRATILELYFSQKGEENAASSFQECSALEMLWQLLNSDFNGLGCRMWPIVFVEVLLAGCTLRSTLSNSDAWLPRPNKKALAKSRFEGLPDESDLFSEAMAVEIEGRISAVGTLAHGDFSLCQTLVESLLSTAWATLPNDESRLALVTSLEALLSQPFFSQFIRVPRLINLGDSTAEQYVRGINAIRLFVNATLKFNPLPVLDNNILTMAADNYNCWHEVLTLLERQYEVLAENTLGERGSKLQNATISAIRRGYSQLEENKIGLALSARSCVLPETEHAVSLDMYDMVEEALGSYSSLVELAEANDQTCSIEPTNFEMDLWEERWVALQGEMCQLPVVYDYASSTSDPLLLLDCAWKTKDWKTVRSLCSSSALLPAIEAGDPNVKMNEILLAINEGKLSDVESLHVQTAQLCLQKWQLLPGVATGSTVHASLLHKFHRLVELRESGQIMVETSNHSKRRTLPDLKNLLSAWRHRLPNDCESLLKWQDIFLWRTHMFSAITANFQWSEAGTLATLHDRPWTKIRMAKTARKQNLREVSLMSLDDITDSTMDVSDAFSKLREQILCYDNPDSDTERSGGLNLVNATNLSYFQPLQKSELFRLKAHFLESLGGRSKANRTYCHSVQICPSYSRAWASWGGLCTVLGRLAERQHEMETAQADNGESKESDKVVTSAKKVAQYLAQAMGCYLEAIQCDPCESSRAHLPKCLWMLSKDGSSPGILCQTLETRGVPLPCWVWLPWIPQLLTSLYRTEGRAVKSLLSRIGKAYPQALYYYLRSFYLERRDVERSRGSSAASGGQQQKSVAYAEELMSLLRRSHAALWSSLEAILEELIVKFKPSFDEELLVYITGILERAESHADRKSLKAGDTSDEETIIASIRKNVSRISTKFFSTPPPTSVKNDERFRKTAEFRRKYKDKFESDFRIEEDDKDKSESKKEDKDKSESKKDKEELTLSEYFDRLKKWRRLLEDQVSSTPPTLPLIESSPSLALFASEAPDLWAGSCDPRHKDVSSQDREGAVDPDGTQPATSSSFVAATTAAALAAQAVAKTAVSEGYGGDFGGGSAAIEIPGQYFPNRTSSEDTKPCPELHVKLIRFESTVSVVRRNEQLVRKIAMVGSDGKTHHFSLQWALPYWTRTEERTAQLFSLFDRILRRGITSSRNFISVQPTGVIPIAQRLRITSEDNSRISLDEVFRKWCVNRGEDYEAALRCFHEEFSKGFEEAKNSELADDDAKAQAEENVRLKALKKVSETCVDKDMLLEFMHEQLGGPEQLFHFRRNYAGQLATDALLQHSCCVVERNPSRTVFLQRNGHVLTPDYRFEYNNHGFLDPRKIPFRMTPNLQSLIGPLLLEGRFIPAMATVASALEQAHDDLEPALRLLLRDDIVAWYTSKSMAKSDSKMQELEKQLLDRIMRNAMHVQTKIMECAPNVAKGESNSSRKDPVDLKVKELVKEATDPRRQCMMPSNYQAWL